MTGNEILGISLALTAEDKDSAPDYSDAALKLLNLMLPELFVLNNNILLSEGQAPLNSIPVISSMDEEIGMDDRITREVLPFGLAAKLALDDDRSKAAYFNGEFMEKKSTLARTAITGIADVYAGEEG